MISNDFSLIKKKQAKLQRQPPRAANHLELGFCFALSCFHPENKGAVGLAPWTGNEVFQAGHPRIMVVLGLPEEAGGVDMISSPKALLVLPDFQPGET